MRKASTHRLPGYLCPHCFECVGYLGRFFAWIFGPSFHGCRGGHTARTLFTEIEAPVVIPAGNYSHAELRSLFLKDAVNLPSGRRFEPHAAVVGIDAGLNVFGGFDTEIPEAAVESDLTDRWSREDKIALAEHMIVRWIRYREAAG